MSKSNGRLIPNLLAQYGNLCYWCGREMTYVPDDYEVGGMNLGSKAATIEHLRPMSTNKLSPSERHPLRLACSRCNNKRSNSEDWIPWTAIENGERVVNIHQRQVMGGEFAHGAHNRHRLRWSWKRQ